MNRRNAENVLAAMGTDRDKWWATPDIAKQACLGFWWSGRLYPALGWLEDHGYVEARFDSGSTPRRRRYRITDRGYLTLLSA